MSNSTTDQAQRQKGAIGVVAALVVLICIGVVWYHDPVRFPRLLLLVPVFAAAAGGMILLSNRTITEITVERLADAESRIDTIVVGTILVVVLLTGTLIETVGLAFFSENGFRATCIGLLASFAVLVIGVLIGFLFGVRMNQKRSCRRFDSAPSHFIDYQ